MQANIGGDVLVLSTGSMSYTHGGTNPAGSDPASCCALCRKTQGCNAWVLCTRGEGCGPPGGCDKYIASLPSGQRQQTSSTTPMVGFGYFGSCYKGSNGSQPGVWPWGTCSLKRVPNPAKPPIMGQGTAAEGWIGGVLRAATQPPPPPAPAAAAAAKGQQPAAAAAAASPAPKPPLRQPPPTSSARAK
jgi:PAN domain